MTDIKRISKWLLAKVCFVSLICASAVFSQESGSQQDTSKQLKEVKKAIAAEKQQINQTKLTKEQLASEIKKDDIAISQSVKSLADTAKRIDTIEHNIVSLKKRSATLTKEKRKQESQLAAQLRSAYSAGYHDYLKLLLNQEQANQIQRNLSYYQYLNQARQQQIESFQATIEELNQVQIEQAEQVASLENNKQKQIADKRQLEKRKGLRQQRIVALNQKLLTAEQQLAKLEAEEQSLVEALERLARLSRQSAELNGLGKLKRQLSWPVKGKVIKSFGSRKQGYLKWKGALIQSPVGRTVSTVHNGTVLFSDWLKGYGLVIVVDHGKGYMSLYGHNQALLKNVGDRVETGEPIALVGQSGGQSQSGLYFEIRHNGQAVNPKLWCR